VRVHELFAHGRAFVLQKNIIAEKSRIYKPFRPGAKIIFNFLTETLPKSDFPSC